MANGSGNASTGASNSPATNDFKKKMQALAEGLSTYGSSAAADAAKKKGMSSGS